MKKNKPDDAPCPQCREAITTGFLFNICEESLSDKLDCKNLTDQYLRGELNADQIAEKIKEAAGNNKTLLKDLNEIEHIRKSGKI